MAQVRALFATAFTVDVTVTGVTETVIATLQGVDTSAPDNTIRLKGWAQIAPGSDQTSLAIAIRRDSVSGALVGEANAQTFAAAGSQLFGFDIMTQDRPGDVASQVYVLTALQAGGVANGSAKQGYLEAIVA